MMSSLAERLNNPGSIKQNGWNERDDWETNVARCTLDPWRGSNEQRPMDNLGHAIFDDVEHGIRAMVRNIQRKYCNGKFTMATICADWAPSADTVGSLADGVANNPSMYAEYVAFKLNMTPFTDLALFNQDGSLIGPQSIGRLIAVMEAMSQFEAGYAWVRYSQWLHGIVLYLNDFGVEEKPW